MRETAAPYGAVAVRRGFTLVGVVVVPLILAVVAAAAVPALVRPRDEADIDAAAQRIELLFRLARDSAVRAGVAVTVTFDSVTGGVWLEPAPKVDYDDAGYATSSHAAFRVPVALRAPAFAAERSGVPAESLELPGSVRIELGRARARFVFAPAGAAFGDSLLLRTATAARLITLDPWSGRAVIH
jgi:type II secretory pathway pseudopilin PulG